MGLNGIENKIRYVSQVTNQQHRTPTPLAICMGKFAISVPVYKH